MQVIIVFLAPLLMVIACLSERRGGPALAGAVGAAPIVVLVGIVSVVADLGAATGRELALSTAAHVAAQVVLASVFARMARARGIRVGLFAGLVGFVAASLVIAAVPRLWAVAASGLALIIGARLIRDGGTEGPSSARLRAAAVPVHKVVALRALVALVAASGIWLASHQFGPGVGGAIGSFPAFSVSLACLIGADNGAAGLIEVLRGLVCALPAYLAFCLAYWAPQRLESWSPSPQLSASASPPTQSFSISTIVYAKTLRPKARRSRETSNQVSRGTVSPHALRHLSALRLTSAASAEPIGAAITGVGGRRSAHA